MKNRWTMKELQEATDQVMINTLITERRSTLNSYTPLDERLKKIDTDKIFKASALLESILSQKGILPVLIGISDELDKIIAERLK